MILYQMLTGGRFPYQVVGNIRDILNTILTAPPLAAQPTADCLQRYPGPEAEKPACGYSARQ